MQYWSTPEVIEATWKEPQELTVPHTGSEPTQSMQSRLLLLEAQWHLPPRRRVPKPVTKSIDSETANRWRPRFLAAVRCKTPKPRIVVELLELSSWRCTVLCEVCVYERLQGFLWLTSPITAASDLALALTVIGERKLGSERLLFFNQGSRDVFVTPDLNCASER